MILFIFNNRYPENTGFGIRCKRAIDSLAEHNDIEILCRETEAKGSNYYATQNKKIPIHTFRPVSPTIDLGNNYIPGLYEIVRNIDLMIQLGLKTIQIFFNNRRKTVKVYVVNSPLTVPLLVLIVSKFFRVSLDVIEFHDLEPELAVHIKNLDKKHFVYKIELFLEKLVCRSFKKVIVTTEAQATRISARTGIKSTNILVIPNTVETLPTKTGNTNLLNSKNFNIGYLSSFTYRYTMEGIVEFIDQFKEVLVKIPEAKLVLVGDGAGLTVLRQHIERNKMTGNVIIITEQINSRRLLRELDVCFIPWKKDEMTETMLPTKLFQYMSQGKVIIAPNFGEFKKILVNNQDSLLFVTMKEVINLLVKIKGDINLRKRLSVNVLNKFNTEYEQKIFKKKFQQFINQ